MKKTSFLFLGLLAAGTFALIGCGSDTTGETTTGTTSATSATSGGGGNGGGGGGSSGSAGGGGAANPAVSCDTYCADIQKNCSMGNSQYADEASCKIVCAAFDEG